MPDFVKAAPRAADNSGSDAPLAFTLASTITEQPALILGKYVRTASLSSLLTRLRATDPPSFLLTEKPILVASSLTGSTYTTTRSVAQDLPFEYTLPKSDLRFSRDAKGNIAAGAFLRHQMTDVREMCSRTIKSYRLGTKFPATFAASGFQNIASATGRHSCHEAVLTLARAALWLVCTFHLSSFTPWCKDLLYHAANHVTSSTW